MLYLSNVRFWPQIDSLGWVKEMDDKYNSAIFLSYGGLVVEKLWMLSRGSVYKEMKCVGVVKTRWSGPLVQVCNGMGLTLTQTNKVSYTEM